MSLRIKVFLFSAMLAIVPLLLAFVLVQTQLQQSGESQAEANLVSSSMAIDQLTSLSGGRLRIEAALLVRTLQLSPEGLEPNGAEQALAAAQETLESSVDAVALLDADGVLTSLAGSIEPAELRRALRAEPLPSSLKGRSGSGLWLLGQKLFAVAAQPIRPQTSDLATPVLLLAREVRAPLAQQLSETEPSEMAIFADRVLIGSSLTAEQTSKLADLLPKIESGTVDRVRLQGEQFLIARESETLDFGGEACNHILLESMASTEALTHRLSGLFASLGLATLAAALGIAWFGSHLLTAPLRESAARMAEMASTGKVELTEPSGGSPEVASFQATFNRLIESLRQSQQERDRSYIEAVGALVIAIDARDNDTTGHSFRVARYAAHLGGRLGMSEDELRALEWGALLHDIGKIAVPDAVLRKAGPLTAEEWHIMHQHPTWGVEMLADVAFLHPALEIIQYHQERWDGLGYPTGLQGDEIPLGARLFAVIDTYDAITSDRPYRRAASHDQALRELRRVAGIQLDPKIVEIFLSMPETELSELREWHRTTPNLTPPGRAVTL